MPPPVVSLSQINKKKRVFAAKVGGGSTARAPSVTPRPPSSRQTTTVPSDHQATSGVNITESLGATSQNDDTFIASGFAEVIHHSNHATHVTIPARRHTQSPEIIKAPLSKLPPTSTSSHAHTSSAILPRPPNPAAPSIEPARPAPIAAPSAISIRPPASASKTLPMQTPTIVNHSVPSTSKQSVQLHGRRSPVVLRSPEVVAHSITSSRPLPSVITPVPPRSVVATGRNASSPRPSQSLNQGAISGGDEDTEFAEHEESIPAWPSSEPLLVSTSPRTQPNVVPPSSKAPRRKGKRNAAGDTEGEENGKDTSKTKSKRVKRSRKSKVISSDTIEHEEESQAEQGGTEALRSPSRKRVRRRMPSVTADGDVQESGVESTGATTDEDGYVPPKKKASTRRARSTTASTSATASTSKTKHPRKSRTKRKTVEEVALEDAEAEEKEHDPTQTTMSALIDDLPVGRSSSTRMEIQERIKANRARDRARREQLRMADRNVTMGKPRDEDVSQTQEPPQVPSLRIEAEGGASAKNLEDEIFGDDDDAQDRPVDGDDEDEDDWIDNLAASSHVPQIGLDEEGNVAPDELRMDIERPDAFREENYEEVFERESDRFVNSLSHSKKHKGSARWSGAETAIFFHNLAMYGTDFESIARVMPGRTRHEVKNKFNSEDRKNPELINEYLFQPKPIDLEEAAKLTGKDLSGPPPEIRNVSRSQGQASARNSNIEKPGDDQVVNGAAEDAEEAFNAEIQAEIEALEGEDDEEVPVEGQGREGVEGEEDTNATAASEEMELDAETLAEMEDDPDADVDGDDGLVHPSQLFASQGLTAS